MPRSGGSVADLFDFHFLCVMLHDAARNVMRLHIVETSEPALAIPNEVPIEGSMGGWVWQNQEPVVI